MKKILLLDTSIGTSNMGDFIIMECVRNELNYVMKDCFVYDMPTHLPAFNGISVLRNYPVVQNYANCDYKFVGGSNILVKDLRTFYPQWNIHAWDYQPMKGAILVGAGAGAGEKSNHYTTSIYKKLLHSEYYHSVRDERSKEYVESLGLKAINTGCVTMWGLTPEVCKLIPVKKASRCVFTLTGRTGDTPIREEEQRMIDILKDNYAELYFWIQGDHDWEYFNRFNKIESIHVIPPHLEAYDDLLMEDDLDYVGTRLHGGIYAMRHKKRAIIIAIDERASEINKNNHLNCIDLSEVNTKLEEKINSELKTEVIMPFDQIEKWKSQFII